MVAYKSWIQKLPTFLLHRPDLSQRAYGYCSCEQETKEPYWGDINFVKWKGTFRFHHLKIDQTGQSGPPSKLVLNNPVRPNWNGSFHMLCQQKFSGILGWMESALCFHFYPLWFTLTHVVPKLSNLKGRGGFLKPTIKSKMQLMRLGFFNHKNQGLQIFLT